MQHVDHGCAILQFENRLRSRDCFHGNHTYSSGCWGHIHNTGVGAHPEDATWIRKVWLVSSHINSKHCRHVSVPGIDTDSDHLFLNRVRDSLLASGKPTRWTLSRRPVASGGIQHVQHVCVEHDLDECAWGFRRGHIPEHLTACFGTYLFLCNRGSNQHHYVECVDRTAG